MLRNEKIIIFIFSVILIVEFFLFIDLPFFWDALSKLQRANWIYTHNFSSLIVPTEINSGHPPLWITGIALFWEIFGKTIWSARLLLLIVNIGVFYQLLIFAKNNFSKSIPIFLVFLVFIEPTLVAQTTILNNDMLLLFFVLLGLNALLGNKYWLYTIALSGILLTNLRGIYCFLAFVIIHIWFNRSNLLYYEKKMLWSYIITALMFIVFLFYQYSELGWILITESKSYSDHREVAGLQRIAKNAAAFIKNLVDFGRIIVWFPLFFMVIQFIRKKKYKINKKTTRILIALFVFTSVFFVGFVPFSNPMGPRYLLISFILANFLFINLLFEKGLSILKRRLFLVFVFIAFLTGHLWIYPSTIAQGWDSSLAYLNYFKQEDRMLQYLEKKKIDTSRLGTNISITAGWLATLDPSDQETYDFKKLNLNENEYVLFSNIENRTEDQDIITLRETWEEVISYSQLGVFITLYKNPESN